MIVVDDGSTDESAAIAEAFGPSVRVLRQANRGESVARNRAMDEARGEWIAFIDADDIWHPTKLERQIEASAGCVAVHTEVLYFGSRHEKTRIMSVSEKMRYSVEALASWHGFCIAGAPSSLMVRAVAAPRFPIWTRYGEDRVFCLELRRRGKFRLVNDVLTGYRQHSGSQTAKPVTPAYWHATIYRWMTEFARLPPETIAVIHGEWMAQLVSLAWILRERRQWDDYWKLRHYLKAYSEHPVVVPFLANRIYPAWLYWLKDRLCGRPEFAAVSLTSKVEENEDDHVWLAACREEVA
jgi:glycosyltransferase involved in cell wall biosynthesis